MQAAGGEPGPTKVGVNIQDRQFSQGLFERVGKGGTIHITDGTGGDRAPARPGRRAVTQKATESAS